MLLLIVFGFILNILVHFSSIIKNCYFKSRLFTLFMITSSYDNILKDYDKAIVFVWIFILIGYSVRLLDKYGSII